MLNGLPWKGTEIILSFLRLHSSTAFWTLLLTIRATIRAISSKGRNVVVDIMIICSSRYNDHLNHIAKIHWIIEKAQEFQKNVYFCFIDYAKAFDCMHHNKLWKILKRHLACFLRNLYAGQEATVRTRYGTMDWFQLEKDYIKAVYYHSAYLTYMQTTSYEMPGWVKHKLESRLPGEISITSDMQMTPPLRQKAKMN